ncbi:MAG TPA: hypothetical protein VM430_10665, partial [Microbacterium sp.]|nr:hypothetical protein [Microbacterium sp.]
GDHMTVPESPQTGTPESKLIRIALWVAIGALIIAALVCVVWVLVGSDSDLVGRALLTILLLAAFAGIALLDARLAPKRPAWFALASMVSWVVALLIGAVMIWMPSEWYYYGSGFGRLVSYLLIVLILQLALLHTRLLMKAHLRHVTGFTRGVTVITIAIALILTILLVLPLMTWEYVTYSDPYWRAVVALAILAAVGTALIPLINALFAPRPARTVAQHPHAQPWPTYVDGVTPLPVMPDGSPDWNAYYTGYPSTVSQAIAPTAPLAPVAYPGVARYGEAEWQPHTPAGPAEDAGAWQPPATAGPTEPPGPAAPHSSPGYEGYPPPPPLPPRR